MGRGIYVFEEGRHPTRFWREEGRLLGRSAMHPELVLGSDRDFGSVELLCDDEHLIVRDRRQGIRRSSSERMFAAVLLDNLDQPDDGPTF
jgi:hypothetical protein